MLHCPGITPGGFTSSPVTSWQCVGQAWGTAPHRLGDPGTGEPRGKPICQRALRFPTPPFCVSVVTADRGVVWFFCSHVSVRLNDTEVRVT